MKRGKRFFAWTTLLSAFAFIWMSACQVESQQSAPASLLLPESALAEYEANIDHARLISEAGNKQYALGQKVYNTTCFSCHGDESQEGSMPKAAKFWEDSLRHGSDPFAMYQTISRGFGLMPAQVQLVPQEKYAVIHFIREFFMKGQNHEQYFEADSSYLAALPAGSLEGPAPGTYRPWAEMDYGNFLIKTLEIADSSMPERNISGGPAPLPDEDLRDANFAYKGISIRLDEGEGGIGAGKAFVAFDHDLMRMAGIWTGEGFIDYEDILMNERHNIYVRTKGKVQAELPVGPGWAHPQTGSFEDPRATAVDGRKFGPLPREWAQYKGLYSYNGKVLISYRVGNSEVLETYGMASTEGGDFFYRDLSVTADSDRLKLRVAPRDMAIRVQGKGSLQQEAGFHVITFPANEESRIRIMMSAAPASLPEAATDQRLPDLRKWKNGGKTQYPQVLETPVRPGPETEAYAADVLTLPLKNPWRARVRPSGIDFLPERDEAVVCTIDGDVWIVRNISATEGNIQWQRIATGLYQPLGIKYHQDQLYVTCRDQLVRLHDLNGDREIDFYESFNSDHQVTEHFHEFAMGLQVDSAGNFYYAKSGRHARKSLVPQHGTLLRVSPDGARTDILANGFRAANGVCLNPDGTFIVTDQEGFWNPMNRINWVEEGGFYGNMWGYGAPDDTSDAAMEQPLCWIDQKFDRSPAELLWADSDRWGPLEGQLLSLSYGYGKIFAVLPEIVNGVRQGGMVQLPLPDFPTGIIRGRFHPKDGQLYVCGMTAWATSQVLQAGGLYRIRYTGEELTIPTALHVSPGAISMEFPCELDSGSAENPANYQISTWQLKRTQRYGSDRYDVKELEINNAELSRNTLKLDIPDLAPTWIMEIRYQLKTTSGKTIDGVIQNTIYETAHQHASY